MLLLILEKNNTRGDFIDHLKEQIVIQQQMALNKRMYEIGKISKQMRDRAHETLKSRLTMTMKNDIINHSKVI